MTAVWVGVTLRCIRGRMARPKDAATSPPTTTPGSGAPLARGSAFAGVEGQAHAVAVLARALENQRLAHGYLWVGPAGVGREMTARRLAAALLCTGRTAALRADEVCGACAACARVDRGLHPDVHLVLTEADAVRRGRLEWTEDRKPAQDIKVDQIRALRDALRLTAFEGGWRVAIIPEAHRLRVEAANALLKTLEEPLPRSLLVLCAPDKGAVLETLRSRCQRVAFSPLDEQTLTTLLQRHHTMDAPTARALAQDAEGSMARALEAEGDKTKAAWEAAQQLRQALEHAPTSDLLAHAEKLEKDRDALDATVRLLARLCTQEAGEAARSAFENGAQAHNARRLLQVADAAMTLRMDLGRPGANARLGVERFLIQARLAWGASTGSRTLQ
jgi:DNA polymerase-3 subunit delta'